MAKKKKEEPTAGYIFKKPPTPQQIDELGELYAKLEEVQDVATRNLDAAWSDVRENCAKWGSAPHDAPKSLRLLGNKYELTLTIGDKLEVSSVGAMAVLGLLIKAKARDLFQKIFEERTSYSVQPGYADVLKQPLPKSLSRLRTLVAAAISVKKQSPRVTVKAIEKKEGASA